MGAEDRLVVAKEIANDLPVCLKGRTLAAVAGGVAEDSNR